LSNEKSWLEFSLITGASIEHFPARRIRPKNAAQAPLAYN